jgi:hypothetical protein
MWESGYLQPMLASLSAGTSFDKLTYRRSVLPRWFLFNAARYRYAAPVWPSLQTECDDLATAAERYARDIASLYCAAAPRTVRQADSAGKTACEQLIACGAALRAKMAASDLPESARANLDRVLDLATGPMAAGHAGDQEWHFMSGMAQVLLLGDIYGNPWDQLSADLIRPYVTPAAADLAASLDDQRVGGRLDHTAMLVLADMLEEAGCPSYVDCPKCDGTGLRRGWPGTACGNCAGVHGEVSGKVPHRLLAHLRHGSRLHMMGCWAVDLVAGRRLAYAKS